MKKITCYFLVSDRITKKFNCVYFKIFFYSWKFQWFNKKVDRTLLFLEICMRRCHNNWEMTWKECGKIFSPLNQFFNLQSSLTVQKLLKIFTKNCFFFFNFYLNGIIILILTQNDHWPHFSSSLSNFSGRFKKCHFFQFIIIF